MAAGEEVGVMGNLSVRRQGVGCIAWLDVRATRMSAKLMVIGAENDQGENAKKHSTRQPCDVIKPPQPHATKLRMK